MKLMALIPMFLLIGCLPSYTVTPEVSELSGFVGEKAQFRVLVQVAKGNLTEPMLVAKCENVEIISQVAEPTLITSQVLIKSYLPERNCFAFESVEFEKELGVRVVPEQQARFQKVVFPKEIKYGSNNKVLAQLTINPRGDQQQFKVVFSSSTPNLKFLPDENSQEQGINGAEIVFNTGEFQDSASPNALLVLPDPGFASVNLQPVELRLYAQKEGAWYLLDEDRISGVIARR